jgi:hypothetical protein
MRRERDPLIRAQITREGSEVEAVVDLLSQGGDFVNQLALKGSLAGPDRTRTTAFRQIAPGRYESRFSTEERGVHFLTLYEEKEDFSSPLATFPLVTPYPREYRELKPNIALLGRLAEETKGEVLDRQRLHDGLKRLLRPDPGRATAAKETWWPMTGLGLLLFLVDLIGRALPGGLRIPFRE